MGAGIFLLQFALSGDVLSRGQLVKQFYASSLTDSLVANGFAPLSTRLPCPSTEADGNGGVRLSDSRAWAEEPPIFHLFAAGWKRLGLNDPAWPGLAVGALFLWALALWAATLEADPSRRFGLFVLVATAPVLMRYFPQHLPDPLAALALTVGVRELSLRRPRRAFACFWLACAVKALAVFGVFFAVLGSESEAGLKRVRPWAAAALVSLACLASFGAWLWLLRARGIPNPFWGTSVLANRHAGSFSLLMTPNYWARFFTWTAAKGVGLPLFSLWLASWRRETRVGEGLVWRVLRFWSLGLLPYWILVRHGNFVHDYYFLVFFVPIAFLGAKVLVEMKDRRVAFAVGALSLVVGLAQPWRFERGELKDPQARRQAFCAMETGRER